MRKVLIALVIAIAALPRIPLEIALPGRTFDLRVEDLILVGLAGMLVAHLARGGRLARTPLSVPIFAYLGIALLTTVIGLAAFALDPARSILYYLKEVEYFLVFLFVVNFVRTREDVRVVTKTLLVAALANVLWFAFQFATGHNQTLFSLDAAGAGFVGASRGESYGPQLLGESSPFSAGSLFMFVFLLAFAGAMIGERSDAKRNAILAVVFLLCLVATLSRASFLGALGGATLLLALHLKRRRARKTAVAVLVLGAMGVVVGGVGVLGRLSGANVAVALGERSTDIWAPLFQAFVENPFLGYGKGALGIVPGLGAGEAHNSYLRLAVEGGIFELVAYLWILAALLVVNGRIAARATTPTTRVLGATAMAGTAALMICAVFQDAFVPVLVNEIFWLLAGLAWVAYRIETAAVARAPPQPTTTPTTTAG